MSSRLAGRLRRGLTDTRADSTDSLEGATDSLDDTALAEARMRAGGELPPSSVEADGVARLEDELEQRPPGRPRARIAALAAVLLVAVVVALVVILSSSSPKNAKQGNGIPAGDTTTTVQRRTLAEHADLDGTLTYGSKLELYDRISGTFTWLPAVGSVIGRGGTLFKVNELPIVLMYGLVPAYRTLKEGISNGVDVKELNENLVVLGYDPYREITDYEHFGAATKAAVTRWQAAEGLPKTGEVELGRVVFAPSARRITEVHVGLGQDPPGGSGSEAPEEKPAAEAKEPTAKEPTAKEPATKEPAEKDKEPAEKDKEPAEKDKEPGAKEPAERAKEPTGKSKEPTEKSKEPGDKAPAKDETADDPGSTKSPSKGSGEPSGSSDKPSDEPESSGAGMLALTTTSTQQLVRLSVEAAQQQLAHVGETVPVTLPNGNRVKGRITSVGTVATESSADGENGGGGATISATITLERRVVHLDQAPVTAELVEESVKNVLTVPATALIATGGGRYAIETLQDGRRTQLEITPGMFADGYVQIEGPGVHEGLTVTEPSE